MKQLIINISDIFIDQINSRFSIYNLFNNLNDNNSIVLNFKDINFISRSATHQLITETSLLQSKGVNISFINLENEVERMIQQVSESIKTNNKKATFVERITFSNEKELDEFLLTI